MAAPLSLAGVRLRILISQPLRFSGLTNQSQCSVPLQAIFKRHYYLNVRELKRFYKNATIATADGWYEINLDKRKLRTPGGNLFRVPNEALALAVATEWNAQEKLVKRHSMHLTQLCNTAIDNPLRKTREDLTESVISFLDTETICYRLEEPPELQALQTAEWEPILDWARDRYGVTIESTYGIAPPLITDESRNIIRRHLMAYSDWALFGYQYSVDAIKSVLLVMAVMDRHLNVERAVELATLEQIFQSRRWGTVEWHHGVDKYALQSRLAASTLFVHWCSENTSVRQKASIASQ
ncbi:hypothetical protein BaRGS_00024048 [Batillaria attramentaria]|uniref:ATP synthase mitochondrial F1 complex assembly factor 2 n=1 Tax=Batillaria attramentaria TaxID=370345 RepID=A0ABD0KCC3_9CAEN